MSRVLITGGGGSIGAYLARPLADRDQDVDLVDDFSRGRLDADLTALVERPNVRLIEKDMVVPGALEDLSADYALIFHLAAILGVANVLDAPDGSCDGTSNWSRRLSLRLANLISSGSSSPRRVRCTLARSHSETCLSRRPRTAR